MKNPCYLISSDNVVISRHKTLQASLSAWSRKLDELKANPSSGLRVVELEVPVKKHHIIEDDMITAVLAPV